MAYPHDRPRRLRRTPELRQLVRETRLTPASLVQPVFVVEGENIEKPIPSLPGQYHYSIDRLQVLAEVTKNSGVSAVILFGIPDSKDQYGSQAWAEDGVVQKAIRRLKTSCPGLLVIADLCLCEYTNHGHCGVLHNDSVDNDATLELLAKTAVSQAEAGADIIAPSDMMDGRIQAVRNALDENDFPDTPILSYAAKYASAFYGPFRDAAASAPLTGDRKGYQMDPANRLEALREIALDLEEGADMVMVKPALPCLDVIREVKDRFGRVTAAYQVSGEYAMIEAAAAAGGLDRKAVILESLLSIRRAGADFILTYWAKEAARWLATEN